MVDKIVYWVTEDSTAIRLGLPPLSGAPTRVNSLAVPMMLLCLIDQLETMDSTLAVKYTELAEWCLKRTLAHVQVTKTTNNISKSYIIYLVSRRKRRSPR